MIPMAILETDEQELRETDVTFPPNDPVILTDREHGIDVLLAGWKAWQEERQPYRTCGR